MLLFCMMIPIERIEKNKQIRFLFLDFTGMSNSIQRIIKMNSNSLSGREMYGIRLVI